MLFNIYGPRAVSDDRERIQFKHTFFMMLQVSLSSLSDQIVCWEGIILTMIWGIHPCLKHQVTFCFLCTCFIVQLLSKRCLVGWGRLRVIVGVGWIGRYLSGGSYSQCS